MEFNEKDVKRFSVILLMLLLGILAFILVKPLLISILAGLILAYIMSPVYTLIHKYIKNKNLAVSIVTAFILLIIIIPIWFITPILVKQIFELFRSSQGIDISTILRSMFPTATDAFVVQANATFLSIISKASSATLETLVNVFINLPVILLNVVILGFVFFFTLRDREYFLDFLSGLSPLNSSKQAILSKQFKDITDSLLYGHVVVGVIQGLIAGVGFLIFGIDNALILTIVAVILSIMPILGPFIVWAPINIYMYATGDPRIATLYLAYNLILVSTIDNFLRAYIVSRKSEVSQVVLMIGMIGGLLVFGIPGLIIGPLVLAYFLTFLKAYKDKTLSSLFSSE